MAKVITNGAAGTTWTNSTGKVQYQLLVDWRHSCGLCCQYDHAIGPLWPTPFHRGCRCKQKAIWPGNESLPFVDFMEKIRGLDRSQQSRVIGRSNLVLVEAGVVTWSDVVTSARVRSLREVVSRQKLTVHQMTGAGVVKRIAEAAHLSVHTPTHEIAEQAKRDAIKHLKDLGVGAAEIKSRFGAMMASRVGIKEGPGGPGGMPSAPTPPVGPKPKPKPAVALPDAADAVQPLSPKEIEKLFGLKLKPEAHATTQFPESPDAVEVVKKLGGSTGAELVRDPQTGQLFVRKMGLHAGHLLEETHADAAYRSLGIDVPEFRRYDTKGAPVKLAVFQEGTTLKELLKTDPKAAEKAMAKVRKGFVVDALLGNWDVVGMDFDNILVGKGGRVYRIDNGGALRYRAQGATKSASQWNGSLGELDSLRNASINPSAAKVFAGITDAEIRTQAKAILKKKEALLASLPQELRGTMMERLKSLEQVATAKPVEKVKRFGQDTNSMEEWGRKHYESWANSLTYEEKEAIGEYTGSGYTWMNRALRSGSRTGLQAAAKKQITALEDALKRAKLAETIEVTRGVNQLRDTGVRAEEFVPGYIYQDKGFMSTSLKDKPPLGASAQFIIRLPKGAPGAYVNAAPTSSVRSEREFLLPPGSRLKVVGRKKVAEVETVIMEYYDGP